MVVPNVSSMLTPDVLFHSCLSLLLDMNIPQLCCLLCALWVLHMILAQDKDFLSAQMQS